LLFALAIQDTIMQACADTEMHYPNSICFMAFYLDDGIVAGEAEAVKHLCGRLLASFSDLGLHMALDKCKVVPAAGATSTVTQDSFAGWGWVPDAGIKVLGAPLGDATFCAASTAKRVAKAQTLLTAVAGYTHAQGALQVLRHCASWGKLVYAARTVPPQCHTAELGEFAKSLRACLEEVVGNPMSDRSWAVAQLSIQHGGLGIRDPSRHGSAAYLASLLQTRALCQRIDIQFDVDDACGGSCLHATEADVRSNCLEQAAFERGSRCLTQKDLSGLLDAAMLQQLKSASVHDAGFAAHIALTSLPGAGAWLTAPPVEDGREIDSELFKVALKRRLRMPVFEQDSHCPLCGQVLDTWGDHALVCQCGGDRTIRHNAMRNAFFEEASEAGTRPEREKAGLLPARPATDEVPASGDLSARRPADVWLPRGASGKGEALDFAVTSGLRADLMRQVATSPELVFSSYEQAKREYKQTNTLCSEAGFRFVPMVVEAHGGGFSKTVRGMIDWIAVQAAAIHHECPSKVSLKIAQRMSCILHRETARAILRRTAPTAAPDRAPPSGWDCLGGTWQ
jgi:hypothetical protein